MKYAGGNASLAGIRLHGVQIKFRCGRSDEVDRRIGARLACAAGEVL